MPRMKFEPTDELRHRVKALVGCGVPQKQICLLIGIRSTKTLRKHFRKELEVGVVEALAQLNRTAFRLATSGRNPLMTKRWLDRWTRRSRMQLGREPEEETHYRWLVEEYQPPMADDDPRRTIASMLSAPTVVPWDGDHPAGDNE